MKIAYPASALDHTNPATNNNLIGNYLIKYFQKYGVEVEVFPAYEDYTKIYYRLKKVILQILTKKIHIRHREPKLLKHLSKKIENSINSSDADLVFVFGTTPVAYLDVNKPIYIITDATFKIISNFNYEFTNLDKKTIENSEAIEKIAFQKAKKIFLSSDWAKQSAINDYKVPLEKIKVVPLGANIDYSPNQNEITEIINARQFNTINLVFIGKFWKRKGGVRTLTIVNELILRGYQPHLTIIGTEVPQKDRKIYNIDKYIEIIPFLNKSIPDEEKRFRNILTNSHFLLFPTLADTFGHVICEANAYGIPVIASDIGGVPEAITNGKNGYLINFESEPNKAVDYIINYFENKDKYKEFAYSSFLEYQNRLNWDVIIQQIIKEVQE